MGAMRITRGRLIRSPRPYLLRFAAWLRLRVEPEWSNRHIGSLIFWRIERGPNRRH